MIIKSLDDVDVEVTFCDAGYSPGSPVKSLMLNTMACWCKVAGGEWVKSPHRSAMTTAQVVRHTNAKDIVSIFSGKEIEHEKESETGSSGNSEAATSDIPTA